MVTGTIFEELSIELKRWHADIRQYFKPKSLDLEAGLLTSVLKATIHAVKKELKVQNTEATKQ